MLIAITPHPQLDSVTFHYANNREVECTRAWLEYAIEEPHHKHALDLLTKAQELFK